LFVFAGVETAGGGDLASGDFTGVEVPLATTLRRAPGGTYAF
jgi:hypothetical protein